MIMLDLCSGLGGASEAMRDRGWDVIAVDVDPRFNPNVVADIRDYVYTGQQPDLIWASPPCTEFSRSILPWIKDPNPPDMSLVLAASRIIREASPRFWIIENVRGAIKWFKPYLGAPAICLPPFFLWGHFPHVKPRFSHKKERLSSSKRAERAQIPYALSLSIAIAIESQLTLYPTTSATTPTRHPY